MVSRAKLTADLTANTAQFETGMERAGRTLKKFSSAAGEAAKTAAAGFGVVATALTALTIKQSLMIDETAKMARSLGVGLSEFQALALVADEAGVGQEQLAVAFTKTQKAISEAAQGSKAYVDAFQRIGLSAQELINLSPDEQFEKIAVALNNIQNPTERTALALEIFGKSGRALVPMLDDVAEKLKQAKDFNDKFNISLNEIDAAKVEEANDSFGRLFKALGGLGNTIAVAVSPAITGLSEEILNAGLDGEDFGKAVAKGMKVAAVAIDVARHAVLGMELFFRSAATGIVDFGAKAVRTFFEVEEAILNSVNAVTGTDFKPSDEIVMAVYELEQSAKRGKRAVGEIITEMQKFEKTSDKFSIWEIEATERAARSVKKTSADTAAARIGNEEAVADSIERTSETSKKAAETVVKSYDKVGDKVSETQKVFQGFGLSVVSALEQAVFSGGELSDVLQSIQRTLANKAFDALGNVLDDIIGGLFGAGNSGGSFFGGEVFGPPVPSFATGIRRVPRDMVARIHKDEQIVPASQARNGGAGNVNVQIINNSSAKVTQQSQQTAQGTDLRIMVDEMVADNLRRPNTKTGQTVREVMGQGLIRR